VAQVVISIMAWRSGRVIPRLSAFPTVNILAQCTVEDEVRRLVYQAHGGVGDVDGEKTLIPWLTTLRVRWATPVGASEGLNMFI
jgi:hypothetical protein